MALTYARFGPLGVLNTAPLMRPHVHGRHPKDLVVLHETVSANVKGLSDIVAVETYLAQKDYGIHGMTDNDGNIAWALGLGDAVFWQAGGVNGRSIGIEQVSDVMVKNTTNTARKALVAEINAAWGIPLRYSDGDQPGVTTHWSVSQHHPESEGHTDCFPVHLGGYYPALEVIARAKVIAGL
jgi:hypothetical protein